MNTRRGRQIIPFSTVSALVDRGEQNVVEMICFSPDPPQVQPRELQKKITLHLVKENCICIQALSTPHYRTSNNLICGLAQ